jgi:hypothetical protein
MEGVVRWCCRVGEGKWGLSHDFMNGMHVVVS